MVAAGIDHTDDKWLISKVSEIDWFTICSRKREVFNSITDRGLADFKRRIMIKLRSRLVVGMVLLAVNLISEKKGYDGQETT